MHRSYPKWSPDFSTKVGTMHDTCHCNVVPDVPKIGDLYVPLAEVICNHEMCNGHTFVEIKIPSVRNNNKKNSSYRTNRIMQSKTSKMDAMLK